MGSEGLACGRGSGGGKGCRDRIPWFSLDVFGGLEFCGGLVWEIMGFLKRSFFGEGAAGRVLGSSCWRVFDGKNMFNFVEEI